MCSRLIECCFSAVTSQISWRGRRSQESGKRKLCLFFFFRLRAHNQRVDFSGAYNWGCSLLYWSHAYLMLHCHQQNNSADYFEYTSFFLFRHRIHLRNGDDAGYSSCSLVLAQPLLPFLSCTDGNRLSPVIFRAMPSPSVAETGFVRAFCDK